MKAGRWIAATLVTFLLGTGAVAGSSYALDIFGMYRDPTGKPKTIFHNERTSKFFLNDRYVPTNFDALLVGGSSTSNWPMAALDFAHFYNESLYGANYVEEKRLVDEALRNKQGHGHYRYAIVVLNPYPMQFHDVHEGGAGETPRWEALGSVNLLREEFYMLMQRLRHTPPQFSPDGGQKMPPPKNAPDPYPNAPLPYDPIALDALRQTLEELRAQGARIVFVQTPIQGDIYDAHRKPLEDFFAAFPLRRPGDLLIDFNAPEYRAFNAGRTRWVDPPHLNDESAKLAAAELNRRIHEAWPELRADSTPPQE